MSSIYTHRVRAADRAAAEHTVSRALARARGELVRQMEQVERALAADW